MAITTAGTYLLIIARYNRDHWNNLKKAQPDGRKKAEDVAEELFPEKIMRLPQVTSAQFETFLSDLPPEKLATLLSGVPPEERVTLLSGLRTEELARSLSGVPVEERATVLSGLPPDDLATSLSSLPPDELARSLRGLRAEELTRLRGNIHTKGTTLSPHLQGVSTVQSFKSDIFARINAREKKEGFSYAALSDDEKETVLDAIFNEDPPPEPIGWIAVVKTAGFASFIQQMSENDSVLWRIYDIQVHPHDQSGAPIGATGNNGSIPVLNDDTTTLEIYNFMTPTNWSMG
jgi:MgtE-like protein